MPKSQKQCFTFTWLIHNFSMCPMKNSQFLCSLPFAVKILEHSEWELRFYPKGTEKYPNFLSFYLLCKSVGTSNVIKTDFVITISSDDSKSRVVKKGSNCVFRKNDELGFGNFISTTDFFGNKEAFLPLDTLTIKCTMWPSGSPEIQIGESLSALAHHTIDNNIELNAQSTGEGNDCSISTRFEVQNKIISWAINNFNSVSFDERLTIPVSSAMVEAQSFKIILYKSTANKSVEIQRDCKSVSEQVLFKCKASVFHAPKGIQYVTEDVHLFLAEVRDVWKLQSFIQLEKLEENKYFNYTSNVLHLRFDFSYSRLNSLHSIEKVSFRHYGTLVTFPEPIEEFWHLYKTGDWSDVVIRTDDRDFKVHKSILQCRSPVFAAMFKSDMKEKSTGVVDINDVDADTLHRMLAFVYSSAFEDLQFEDAIKLYSAADKYQILSLKFRCCWVLANCICVSNVCDVMILADRHNDSFLRHCAESFVRTNSMEVLRSLEWTNLMKDYGTIAANVMHRMLIR